MGIPEGFCPYQRFLSPSPDAAPASRGLPETLRQPASSEVPTPACRYHFLISTPPPSLALPPPLSSLTPLPPLPQESPDASRESMVKLSVSFP